MEERLSYLKEQGINVESAMRYADESWELYRQLISIFIEEYEQKRGRIESAANASDEEYRVLVHGLKNNARAVGAEKLSGLAYEHEKAVKQENWNYIQMHLTELFSEWEKAIQSFTINN